MNRCSEQPNSIQDMDEGRIRRGTEHSGQARQETAMTGKRAVWITIESAVPGEKNVQTVRGELYRLGKQTVVRYTEPDASLGRTMTTVKLAADAIRIIRHGDVRSEQTFLPQQRCRGFYETSQGRLDLETETRTLHVQFADGSGLAVWDYDLTIGGQHAGKFRLRMSVREAEF